MKDDDAIWEMIRGMVHRGDPLTSVRAATKILPRVGKMHEDVLFSLARAGGMTDEELEKLPRFGDYGPSTVRKRRSELYQAGKIVPTGERSNSRGYPMTVWGLAPAQGQLL